MSTSDLPLDEAALDRIESGELGVGPSIGDRLIAQARAALTLRARVAELEQRERDSDKAHACQVARVEILLREKAELEAELADARETATSGGPAFREAYAAQCAHAHALRDALESGNRRLGYWCDLHGSLPEDVSALAGMQAALASTPAADLSAYRKSVLEEAAKVAEHHAQPEPKMSGETFYRNPSALVIARDIRALAAQEVKP